mmetsp:Transcript_6077/g.784  ORF Transcript_6077/g.784 Transcript_6077/m.784 type:complete len:150 (-) Transcript_6077:3-452(-)
MFHSSKLVDMGMWFIKKWKKSLCLKQLGMSDSGRANQTFLYGLSQIPCFSMFKHILLLSSFQDKYVPFESARIEVRPKVIQDVGKGQVYQEMANSLLEGCQADLHRLDVGFVMAKKGINSMIGRTAHIYFLENQALYRVLIFRYTQFFI